MFARLSTRRAARAALVLALAATGACGDATGPDDDDDDHQEAAGMVITDQSNVTLVSVSAQRQVTGTLTVAAGQARHLEVYFVDEDGDRFQLDDGDEHALAWEVANESVATIDSHDGHLDLDGVAAGSTTVVFSLLHGNHSDYDSPAIPITVTP
ncbi:MAG TPA: Ig-like domain-containing protein [Longimicrobium sp.]|nr:Ig-like domain-containing protein [Longimicrobium sp.]